MNFKAVYVLKQVKSDDTKTNLLPSTMIGEYCKKDFLALYKNKDIALSALSKITTEHIIGDNVYTLLWNVYNTIVYVNRNRYFMIFTEYSKTVIPTGGLLGGLESDNSSGWFIFQDIQYSGINAYILSADGTANELLGSDWMLDTSSDKYEIFENLKTFPNSNIRTWTRFTPPCIRCLGVNTVCTNNPSQEDLNMRRKAQTLLYKRNSSNLSKKRILSNQIQQKGSSGKNYWATQNSVYTNPNTNNLVRVNNTLLINPSGFSIDAITVSQLTITDNIKNIIIGNYCSIVSNQELSYIIKLLPQLHNKNVYLTYKNNKNSYLLSTDKNVLNGELKYGYVIYTKNNGTVAYIFATCSYNVTKEKYSSAFWTISPTIPPINLVNDNDCKSSCKVPSYSPRFSDVPGKGPNLILDKNVPLTRYITKRTYKGTVNN